MSKVEQIPLSRSLLWILLSTLMVSGTALMAMLYYWHLKDLRLHDSQSKIVALVQQCNLNESLKTSYLAQLLSLSLDRPTNLYRFRIVDGEKQLKDCPLIKNARIQKIPPGTLYVQYDIRIPLAYLGDYTNTAMDSDGYLFPFQPFFKPKKLPMIYTGEENRWGELIGNQEKFLLARDVLNDLEPLVNESMSIKQIDVANAFSESDGNRQIVVIMTSQMQGNDYILRLNPDQYREGLKNFRQLKSSLKQSPQTIIDLRISHLAFVKNKEV